MRVLIEAPLYIRVHLYFTILQRGWEPEDLFQRSLTLAAGQKKSCSGPHLAHGPQVGDPVLVSYLSTDLRVSKVTQYFKGSGGNKKPGIELCALLMIQLPSIAASEHTAENNFRLCVVFTMAGETVIYSCYAVMEYYFLPFGLQVSHINTHTHKLEKITYYGQSDKNLQECKANHTNQLTSVF